MKLFLPILIICLHVPFSLIAMDQPPKKKQKTLITQFSEFKIDNPTILDQKKERRKRIEECIPTQYKGKFHISLAYLSICFHGDVKKYRPDMTGATNKETRINESGENALLYLIDKMSPFKTKDLKSIVQKLVFYKGGIPSDNRDEYYLHGVQIEQLVDNEIKERTIWDDPTSDADGQRWDMISKVLFQHMVDKNFYLSSPFEPSILDNTQYRMRKERASNYLLSKLRPFKTKDLENILNKLTFESDQDGFIFLDGNKVRELIDKEIQEKKIWE